MPCLGANSSKHTADLTVAAAAAMIRLSIPLVLLLPPTAKPPSIWPCRGQDVATIGHGIRREIF
jgi:hypothetical protein